MSEGHKRKAGDSIDALDGHQDHLQGFLEDQQMNLPPPETEMPTTQQPSGNAEKKRTWERHRWSFKHDETLFEQVIHYQAWSKKFGGILKRWDDVGKALMGDELFKSWGHLKTDMLRRRFDKPFKDQMKILRQKGYDLGAISPGELTDLQKKVIQVKDSMATDGVTPENDHKNGGGANSMAMLGNAPYSGGSAGGSGGNGGGQNSKKRANKRKEELDIIKETVASFLKNKQDPGQMDVLASLNYQKEVAASMKTLQNVELEERTTVNGDLVKKIMVEQFKLTNHLVQQNDLLVNMLTKVLAKHLGEHD